MLSLIYFTTDNKKSYLYRKATPKWLTTYQFEVIHNWGHFFGQTCLKFNIFVFAPINISKRFRDEIFDRVLISSSENYQCSCYCVLVFFDDQNRFLKCISLGWYVPLLNAYKFNNRFRESRKKFIHCPVTHKGLWLWMPREFIFTKQIVFFSAAGQIKFLVPNGFFNQNNRIYGK